MDIKMHFDHFNINVMDLENSLKFYKDNLGLTEVGEKRAADGSFILKYLSSPGNDFRLELTWLRDHKGPYELGENESHLALRFDGDYDEIHELHKKNGVICFENPSMGIYFIHDPDDYWIEILRAKK
ncbi:MAG: lactoylglutathione lyase [Bacteroides sp.]|nr:lactoylglutathione lyase [Bacteroidales bacterium]MBD5291641.1 lactoylglutathione lyase [Bacteroides sp.]MBD5337608.1 lactoylglutathione lyase [Bacteroides sp.]MBD5338838.1 lactoylglutathione lyase [Bacteroides sp.]